MVFLFLLSLAAARQKGDSNWGWLIFLTLLIAATWVMNLIQFRRIDKRMAAAVETLKREMPPLLRTDDQIRAEMQEFRKRLGEIEAMTVNVQRQVENSRRRR